MSNFLNLLQPTAVDSNINSNNMPRTVESMTTQNEHYINHMEIFSNSIKQKWGAPKERQLLAIIYAYPPSTTTALSSNHQPAYYIKLTMFKNKTFTGAITLSASEYGQFVKTWSDTAATLDSLLTAALQADMPKSTTEEANITKNARDAKNRKRRIDASAGVDNSQGTSQMPDYAPKSSSSNNLYDLPQTLSAFGDFD
jgi:hypothetical protein